MYMQKLLPTKLSRAGLKLFLLCVGLAGAPAAQAQCPVANSCTPVSAPSSTFPFGMGIFSVTVGTGTNGFTNTTSGSSDGYKDYSCTKKATVLEGVATTIAINTNTNSDENVR